MTYVTGEVFELRQRVAKLERQVAFLTEHLGLVYEEAPNADVPAEVLDLLRRGDKLGAIRYYRETTGLGLREAKEFVESIEV